MLVAIAALGACGQKSMTAYPEVGARLMMMTGDVKEIDCKGSSGGKRDCTLKVDLQGDGNLQTFKVSVDAGEYEDSLKVVNDSETKKILFYTSLDVPSVGADKATKWAQSVIISSSFAGSAQLKK